MNNEGEIGRPTIQQVSLKRLSCALTLLIFIILIPNGVLAQVPDSVATSPNVLSILPAIVAIALALALRQVIPAIFAGLWTGAMLVHGLSFTGLWHGLLDTFGVYLIDALADKDLCVCEMTELVGADQSTVSKHLAILKETGFLQMEKHGAMNVYSLRCQCLEQFFGCIESVLRQKVQAQQELVEI